MTLGVCRKCVLLLVCACAAMRAESPDERWLKLQSEGARLREQGKYEDARRAYEDALRVAESTGSVDSRLAQTLNNLAASCYDGGHYAEAESYYRRALDIWKPDESADGRRNLASLWGNLAALYAATARDNQAEPLYRKAIGLADQPNEESSALRVTLLSDLAGLYLKQGRPGDAEPLLLGALDGWETKPETTRLALLLNNLAASYQHVNVTLQVRSPGERSVCYLRLPRYRFFSTSDCRRPSCSASNSKTHSWCLIGSERESDETATFTQLSSPAELRGTDVGHRHPLGHG